MKELQPLDSTLRTLEAIPESLLPASMKYKLAQVTKGSYQQEYTYGFACIRAVCLVTGLLNRHVEEPQFCFPKTTVQHPLALVIFETTSDPDAFHCGLLVSPPEQLVWSKLGPANPVQLLTINALTALYKIDTIAYYDWQHPF